MIHISYQHLAAQELHIFFPFFLCVCFFILLTKSHLLSQLDYVYGKRQTKTKIQLPLTPGTTDGGTRRWTRRSYIVEIPNGLKLTITF